MNRKSLIAIISLGIIIALAIGSFYYLKNSSSKTADSGTEQTSHKFIGQVTKIEGNTISARGIFFLDSSGKIGSGGVQDVTINTLPDTRFVKTLVYREKAVVGQAWDPSKLRKQEVSSSLVGLSELATKINGLDITVVTNNDILNETAFTANSITYSEEVYP